jgi:hypothetical protein
MWYNLKVIADNVRGQGDLFFATLPIMTQLQTCHVDFMKVSSNNCDARDFLLSLWFIFSVFFLLSGMLFLCIAKVEARHSLDLA